MNVIEEFQKILRDKEEIDVSKDALDHVRNLVSQELIRVQDTVTSGIASVDREETERKTKAVNDAEERKKALQSQISALTAEYASVDSNTSLTIGLIIQECQDKRTTIAESIKKNISLNNEIISLLNGVEKRGKDKPKKQA